MADTPNTNTPASNPGTAEAWWPGQDPSGIPTTPVAPPGGRPAYPGDDISNIPTTPVAPPGGIPAYPGDSDVPTTPIAPPGGIPSYPGTPTFPWPDFPTFPTPDVPSTTYFSQVRFLNASTSGLSLDVYVDNNRVLSGSTFATVSTYIQIADGFHTITVRITNGRILYQQNLAFVSGEKVTMVLLDIPNGITISTVSDMGCTNVPSGFGCCRVANMSFRGSNYDIRLFNNQVAFSNIGFREVTSYKQTSAGNYTFFVTDSQPAFQTIIEVPVLILSALVGGSCLSCAVNNPVLSYNLTIEDGKAYTSYIIGNPWSNLLRVMTLED